jgi:uncharacterized membrane protein
LTREGIKSAMRWAMATLYVAAGVAHLRSPDGFLAITPDWVPMPREVILATGVCELFGAAGLLIPKTRGLAGVMLALYALCVFPANIKHAIDHVPIDGIMLDWRYHVPRLAAQPVLIWWALFCADVIDWPWRRRGVQN